ncbi:MAG TPA: hypothetical protein VMZ33_06095, partial [Candidatus Limnocylindrales bacterium]|nr:hypothetical protein [Candidatus Limnocylindrales bacterium]
MSRSLLALLLAVFATIGGASAAMAHFGSEAAIIVPADYLLPGQQFDAVAVDLAPGSVVSFEMRRDALVVALGSAPSPGDGHFTLTMAVPADFPTGYAELVGTSSDGTSAMTWVLVGERNPATPAAPPG